MSLGTAYVSPLFSFVQIIDTRLNSSTFVNKDDVDVGLQLLSFVLSGVRSKSLLSPAFPSTTATVVGGTWGEPFSPMIYSITARDTGWNVGFGNGDSIVLVFDQLVTLVSVVDTSAVHSLLQFSPTLFDIGGDSMSAVSVRTYCVLFPSVFSTL
jgi:hypothetical protein